MTSSRLGEIVSGHGAYDTDVVDVGFDIVAM